MPFKGHKCKHCQKVYECRVRDCILPDDCLCGDCFAHYAQEQVLLAVREDRFNPQNKTEPVNNGTQNKHRTTKKTLPV